VLLVALAALLSSVAGLGCIGCDVGHQDDQPTIGSPDGSVVPVTVSLVSATVKSGDPVVLQFNRFLNPGAVNRQTILISTTDGTPVPDPLVDYDPVLLRVTLSQSSGNTWLTSGQNYTIKVIAATATAQGVLAIDNATLAMTAQLPLGVSGSGTSMPAEPTMHFCVDILPILVNHCSGAPCHSAPAKGSPSPQFPDGSTSPAAGLVLDDSEGVIDTAIGHVAHGSNVGPYAGMASSPSCLTMPFTTCLFGVDMPIIDPGTNGSGDPGNSWLLYKTLLAVPPTMVTEDLGQCAPETTYLSNMTPSPVITSAERAVLSNYILGSPMPYPANPGLPEGMSQQGTLPVAELERIRLWIKQGAQLETVTVQGADGGLIDAGLNCSMCEVIVDSGAPPADAPSDGPTDAPPDAGGAKD
jgi:hypothetical protein